MLRVLEAGVQVEHRISYIVSLILLSDISLSHHTAIDLFVSLIN